MIKRRFLGLMCLLRQEPIDKLSLNKSKSRKRVCKTPGTLKLRKTLTVRKKYSIVLLPTEKEAQPDTIPQKDWGSNE